MDLESVGAPLASIPKAERGASEMNSTAVEKILPQLQGVKQTGSAQWQARCPAHEDRHPSLSIGTGNDGRVLLKCHAGCTVKDILAAIGLTERDLFIDSGPKAPATVTATYDYCDADGVLLYQVVRFSDKTFKQRRPDSKGHWINNIKGVPRILYRLPDVMAADPDTWIFVVEGEKDVDNLARIGLVATTNSGGAGKWKHLSDESAIYNHRVVVIPDKDKAGYDHAQEVCGCLSGKVKELRYLQLPGQGKDASDWIEAAGTKEELLKLVEAAPSWTPCSGSEEPWPKLQTLHNPLPDVMPFDARLLPYSFHGWIMDIAERMQCPPDFPAVAAMVALAGVVGRKIAIRPKRFDDWTVIPNLWGALIGRPSMMKTPPLKAIMKPLDKLIDAAANEYSEQLAIFNQHHQIAALRKNVIEGKIKTAIRGERDYEQLAFELAGLDAITPPQRRRYVVNDCTVQALGQILAENPNGIIIVRDELIGLLKVLESQGQEAARAFYLEGWDGNGRHETDRIGRGNVKIEAICLSVIGTIQPGPLQQYLHEAITGGIGDDGLIQRFQLAVWPDDPKTWINVDRIPDQDARAMAFEVFTHAEQLTSEYLGAQSEGQDEHAVPFLHFTAEAQAQFDQWMVVRENNLRQGKEEGPMESHLTKYRSLIPSLALLIHIAEFATGPVDCNALERAIGWGDYLASHARRIYASAQAAETLPENLLAAKIQQGFVEDGFSARDVYTNHWSGLNDKSQAEQAVKKLVELGWLREEKVSTGGRPTAAYRIHPQLQKSAQGGHLDSDAGKK
jgi:hypothetical protein